MLTPDPLATSNRRHLKTRQTPSSQLARRRGSQTLPAITPHSLRRTWATFAALAGRDQNWIADQIGHTRPHFTFSVYEQVHRRRYVDEQAIWELMRFADEPAERASSRQVTRSSDPSSRTTIGTTGEQADWDNLMGATSDG